MTQAELGARLGNAQPSVARLERPDANPTWNTLMLALRVTGHDLQLVPRARARLDRGQLRERLALTPAQRLEVFERSQRNVLRMRAVARQTSRE
jgi:transcriptional regulator with XRE-family HTH domain